MHGLARPAALPAEYAPHRLHQAILPDNAMLCDVSSAPPLIATAFSLALHLANTFPLHLPVSIVLRVVALAQQTAHRQPSLSALVTTWPPR